MCFPTTVKYLNSLPGRLTLWYATSFGLCFLVVFGAFYFIMRHHFHHWTDEQLKYELSELHLVYAQQGLEGVQETLDVEEVAEGGRLLARVLDRRGTAVLVKVPKAFKHIGVNRELAAAALAGKKLRETVESNRGELLRVLYAPLTEDLLIQIGLTLQDHEVWMRDFSTGLLQVTLLALVLTVSAGAILARRAIAPIREMARMAATISGRSKGLRMPVTGRGDEVDQLAVSFNGMLERIDRLLQGLEEVTETLAHDLRTPVTGMRGTIEVTLSAPREPEVYKMALYQMMEQLDRLLNLFSTILNVSEAEAGALVLGVERVPIDALASDLIEMFKPVALEKGVTLRTSISPGLSLPGDRGLLGQVLANLLDNAIKYTPPGGEIDLSVQSDPHARQIVISVADTGSGIPEKDLPHIFERYYRGDRSRSGPGAGLGLPLVQGIVRTHGGKVTVESEPGKGSVFRVFLPSTSSSPGLGRTAS